MESDPLLLLLTRIDQLCLSALSSGTPSSVTSLDVKYVASKETEALVTAKSDLEARLARSEVDAASASRLCSELEVKNAELKDTVVRLKQELASTRQLEQDASAARKESEDELVVTKKLLEQADKQTDLLQQRVDSLNAEHAAQASRTKQFEIEQARLTAELASREADYTKHQRSLEARLKEVQDGAMASQGDATSTLSAARQAQQIAEQRAAEADVQMRTASAGLQSAEENAARLRQEVAHKEASIAALQTRLDKSEATNKASAGTTDRLATAHSEALAAAAAQAQRSEAELRALLKAQEAAQAAERRRFEGLLSRATEEVLTATGRADEAAETAAALEKDRDELSSTLTELRALMLENMGAGMGAATGSTALPVLSAPPAVSQQPQQTSVSHDTLLLESGAPPLLLVEIGAFAARVGYFDIASGRLVQLLTCPATTASPLPGKAQAPALVKAARERMGDKRFDDFRQSGMFVGEDAFYMCFCHPDAGLRGNLVLDSPGVIQGGRVTDAARFAAVIRHCVLAAVGVLQSQPQCPLSSSQKQLSHEQLAAQAQVLYCYPPAFTEKDFSALGHAMFDGLQCTRVGVLNSAALSLATDPRPSVLLVDIGSESTSVYPQYERIVMRTAVQSTGVGGEHVTAMLERLMPQVLSSTSLLSEAAVGAGGGGARAGAGVGAERAENLVPRRRMEAARQAKEQCAFFSQDYEQDCQRYGPPRLSRVQVMGMGIGGGADAEIATSDTAAASATAAATKAASAQEQEQEQASHAAARAELTKVVTVSLPAVGSGAASGSDSAPLTITLSAERFHSAEVLFQPSLLESCAHAIPLVDCILKAAAAVDESVRAEICGNVVLSGRSALLPGLAERLTRELREGMAKLGVASVCVQCAELGVGAGGTGGGGRSGGSRGQRWEGSACWRGVEDMLVRCAGIPATFTFVSAAAFEESGGVAFEVAACSY